jgi:hypothetical protein
LDHLRCLSPGFEQDEEHHSDPKQGRPEPNDHKSGSILGKKRRGSRQTQDG